MKALMTLLGLGLLSSHPVENEEALQLLNRGEYQLAAKVLQEQVEQGIALPESYLYLGFALIRAGDFKGATEPLEKYVETVPQRPDGWLNLGLAYFGQQGENRSGSRPVWLRP